MNAQRSAAARVLLAAVLAAATGVSSAGFVDNRPVAAPAAVDGTAPPAVGAVGAPAVATPVAGPSSGAAVAAPGPALATPSASLFTISRKDRTIREALVAWAKRAGWTHEPEHWTLSFDLPVLSSADLGADFKTAVRALLSSTELTSTPLQPCFYSNNVLRVVPKAELCDKNAS